MKRNIFLGVVLLVLAVPVFSQSADSFEVEQLRDGTVSITRLKNGDSFANTNVVVPSTLFGFRVTRIGNGAFTPVTDPHESIRRIGRGYGFTGLTLPDSIVEIGDQAFNRTFISPSRGFANIVLPNQLRRIGNLAFAGWGNIDMEMARHLNNTEFITRNNVNVRTIILPRTLEFVGANAFLGLNIVYLRIENAFSVPRNFNNNNRVSPVFAGSNIFSVEIIGNLSDEWLNFVFDNTGFVNFYVSQGRRAGVYLLDANRNIWEIGTMRDVDELLKIIDSM